MLYNLSEGVCPLSLSLCPSEGLTLNVPDWDRPYLLEMQCEKEREEYNRITHVNKSKYIYKYKCTFKYL